MITEMRSLEWRRSKGRKVILQRDRSLRRPNQEVSPINQSAVADREVLITYRRTEAILMTMSNPFNNSTVSSRIHENPQASLCERTPL